MRRRSLSLSLVLAFLVALVWAGPASADSDRRRPRQHNAVFRIHMTGDQEVPLGDPDGAGNAVVQIGPANFICYRVVVRNVDMPTAAHIHIGVRGAAGPIVVPSAPGVTTLPGIWVARDDGAFVLEGCVVDSDAPTLRRAPGGFYLNVHNPAFPAGAVRGQLH